MSRFLQRIGAVLVNPMAAQREAAQQRGGRGAVDIGFLLAIVWLAEQLPVLAHAFFRALSLGAGAGFQSLIGALYSLLPTILGVMMGAFVMSLLAGKPKERAPDQPPPADAVDLSAYAVVPFVVVTASIDFYFSMRGYAPSEIFLRVATAVALAWSIAVWLCGVVALRDQRASS